MRIQKVLSEGSNFGNDFFPFFVCVCVCVEEGSKYHYKGAIIGPSAKGHFNGVLLVCRCWPKIECWLDSFVIFQGIRTSIAKKALYFCDFSGRGVQTLCPPPFGSKHVSLYFVFFRGVWTPAPLWIRACYTFISHAQMYIQ